ncbi:MAG: galactokinase [Clostridia bacterium]|nr:galactokinase [Clostridia bacterium]
MARALTKVSILESASFRSLSEKLYDAPIDSVAERYSSLTEGLSAPVRFFSSSGRAEMIGNHTDHNHGYVIASAIDMDVVAAVNVTDGDSVTIRSVGYPAFTVRLDDDAIDENLYGTSDAILKGVLKGFRDRGRKVGPFIANTHSTIFKGAGVSSSAAFELLLCEILNVLYNDGKMDYKEMALISQYAENVYFGKPSGLMDQLTVAHGGVSYMDFFDPATPSAKSVEWTFSDLKLVIVNCGGDHCDLTDEYAAIRSDMHAIAGAFGKKVLREVDKDAFFAALPELKNKFSGRAILRAMHFFEEDERVFAAFDAIKDRDADAFLRLTDESGRSSYELLQNCYPKGDVAQPIPLALQILKRLPDTLACRVHGGGFAGTVLSYVNRRDAAPYIAYLKKLFGEKNVFGVSVRNFGAIEVTL